jgi:hydroxymethylpyrimidine/phosphomethylpyrimidine kinase
MTATTALTAQNTTGVDGIHYVPPEFIRKQIDAVFKDIRPDVVKTGESGDLGFAIFRASYLMIHPGMLASAATIEMLAKAIKDYNVEKLVLDPVSRRNRVWCKPKHLIMAGHGGNHWRSTTTLGGREGHANAVAASDVHGHAEYSRSPTIALGCR